MDFFCTASYLKAHFRQESEHISFPQTTVTIYVDTPLAIFVASKGIQQKQEGLMKAVEAHMHSKTCQVWSQIRNWH